MHATGGTTMHNSCTCLASNFLVAVTNPCALYSLSSYLNMIGCGMQPLLNIMQLPIYHVITHKCCYIIAKDCWAPNFQLPLRSHRVQHREVLLTPMQATDPEGTITMVTASGRNFTRQINTEDTPLQGTNPATPGQLVLGNWCTPVEHYIPPCMKHNYHGNC